jgi:hypothetical protein
MNFNPALPVSARTFAAAREHAQVVDGLWLGLTRLLIFQAAQRFRVSPDEIVRGGKWPTPAARACGSVMYVLRTAWSEQLTLDDVAILTNSSRRRVTEMMTRIVDTMDEDASLDHWLGDLVAAIAPHNGAARDPAQQVLL